MSRGLALDIENTEASNTTLGSEQDRWRYTHTCCINNYPKSYDQVSDFKSLLEIERFHLTYLI